MKQLYKSNTDKILFGVCGGIGEYFGISGALIRLIFIVFTLAGGSGVLLYILAAIIIPRSHVHISRPSRAETMEKNEKYESHEAQKPQDNDIEFGSYEDRFYKEKDVNIYQSKE